MSGPKARNDPRAYVRAVIDAYVRLPATPTRPRREDRHLAAELQERGVPFEVVEAALLLATVRRAKRSTQAPPLTPIRSLHYFLPVIQEILRDPPQPSYLNYLRHVVAEHLGQCAESQARAHGPTPACVQKTTVLHER